MTRRRDSRRYQTELDEHLRHLALLDTAHETGFWDDNGRPAPWPDDIDEWSPTTNDPSIPGEPPF
jgi:hypothetical protein